MLDRSSGTWQAAGGRLVFLDLAQWSSTRVVGYTMQPFGTVNVTLSSTGFYGPTYASASYSYSQVSPYISTLVGSSTGYKTAGGDLIVLRGG